MAKLQNKAHPQRQEIAPGAARAQQRARVDAPAVELLCGGARLARLPSSCRPRRRATTAAGCRLLSVAQPRRRMMLLVLCTACAQQITGRKDKNTPQK